MLSVVEPKATEMGRTWNDQILGILYNLSRFFVEVIDSSESTSNLLNESDF